MSELRSPLVSFGGGEIIVEDSFSVLWVDSDDASLDFIKINPKRTGGSN